MKKRYCNKCKRDTDQMEYNFVTERFELKEYYGYRHYETEYDTVARGYTCLVCSNEMREEAEVPIG